MTVADINAGDARERVASARRLAVQSQPSGDTQATAPTRQPGGSSPSRAARDTVTGAEVAQPFLGMHADARTKNQGPEVRALKRQLQRMKYLVDGGDRYTQATADAVMAFQKVNGLDRDGVVGPQTRSALARPKRPVIAATTGSRAEIDLSDQVLFMVRDGKLRYIVNISSGNPALWEPGTASYTPTGRFKVGRKVLGTDPGPSGPLYSPNYFYGVADSGRVLTRNGSGFAVHGSGSIPGQPASHGCVRVPRTSEDELFRDLPLEREIYIHQ